jgi:hypothetical protein
MVRPLLMPISNVNFRIDLFRIIVCDIQSRKGLPALFPVSSYSCKTQPSIAPFTSDDPCHLASLIFFNLTVSPSLIKKIPSWDTPVAGLLLMFTDICLMMSTLIGNKVIF